MFRRITETMRAHVDLAMAGPGGARPPSRADRNWPIDGRKAATPPRRCGSAAHADPGDDGHPVKTTPVAPSWHFPSSYGFQKPCASPLTFTCSK